MTYPAFQAVVTVSITWLRKPPPKMSSESAAFIPMGVVGTVEWGLGWTALCRACEQPLMEELGLALFGGFVEHSGTGFFLLGDVP